MKKVTIVFLFLILLMSSCAKQSSADLIAVFKTYPATLNEFCGEKSYTMRIITRQNDVILTINNSQRGGLYFYRNLIPSSLLKKYSLYIQNEEIIIKEPYKGEGRERRELGEFSTSLFLFQNLNKNLEQIKFEDNLSSNALIGYYNDQAYLWMIYEELIIPYAPEELIEEYKEYLDDEINFTIKYKIEEEKPTIEIFPIAKNKEFYITEYCA